MSSNDAIHTNIGLDEFLVSAGDQAQSILNTLPHIFLTDERFRHIAAQEKSRREKEEEKARLEALVERAAIQYETEEAYLAD